MSKAVVACRQLAVGQTAVAAGKTLERELQGCCNLLADCSEGRSPTTADVAKMNPFSILFLKRAENSCDWNPDDFVEHGGAFKVARVQLQGHDASEARFQKCAGLRGSTPDNDDLEVFRQVRWML